MRGMQPGGLRRLRGLQGQAQVRRQGHQETGVHVAPLHVEKPVGDQARAGSRSRRWHGAREGGQRGHPRLHEDGAQAAGGRGNDILEEGITEGMFEMLRMEGCLSFKLKLSFNVQWHL